MRPGLLWSSLALAGMAPLACGGSPRAASAEASGPAGPVAAVKLEDLRGSLSRVEVVGVTGERADQARAVLASAVGKPFDRDVVAADMRSLWALRGLADVTADATLLDGGVSLKFRLVSQPRIRTVDVRGAHEVTADNWRSQMPVKSGELLDPARLAEVQRGMIRVLLDRGHHRVKVAWNVTPSAQEAGTADVVFTIEEGPAVTIARITFRGNKALSQKALSEVLARGGNKVGGRYFRAALENAFAELYSSYYDAGYVNVSIGPLEETIAAPGNRAEVVIPVVEGAQFRVGKLTAAGQLQGSERDYLKQLGIKTGQIFSRKKVAEGLERIRAFHQAKGAARVDVQPETSIDLVKKRIDLVLRVSAAGG